jgi:hypothetical protein
MTFHNTLALAWLYMWLGLGVREILQISGKGNPDLMIDDMATDIWQNSSGTLLIEKLYF